MNQAAIKLTIDDNGVATVLMDNAAKGNAFDDTIISQLTQAFNEVEKQNSVRVMILASTGKHFCTGADLNWMRKMINYSLEENLVDARRLAKLFSTLNNLPIPTIARIQGACYGGAVGLASCCDMVVATPEASFCLSEVKIGLIPATIAPYVIAAIGERAARRYFNTAEVIPAENAERIGLVSHLAEQDALDATIGNIVKQLLNNSPAALRQSKALIEKVTSSTIDDALIEDTSQRIANIRVSEEGQEGLSAFIEKRSASYARNL